MMMARRLRRGDDRPGIAPIRARPAAKVNRAAQKARHLRVGTQRTKQPCDASLIRRHQIKLNHAVRSIALKTRRAAPGALLLRGP
jgi:hypothetical protein